MSLEKPSPLPLISLPAAVCIGLRGIFTDIDDTVLTHGRLQPRTYAAINALHDAGLMVIPTTGRDAGGCEFITRTWPVDAVVGESGAFWMRLDPDSRRFTYRSLFNATERAERERRYGEIAQRILREVPGCALANQPYLHTSDLAIDYCDEVPPLPPAAVDTIVAIMREEGMTAQISSINVNGWFGDYNKQSGARLVLREAFGLDLEQEKGRFLFIGDAPNDVSMFGFFPHSVGVANVRRFLPTLAATPRYITSRECGEGFVEMAEHILHHR